ncbi:MAG: dUTP diphosphatase [Clostridia bacterium]|nr:dUTP diphosphatase [Clostridia bacterium]
MEIKIKKLRENAIIPSYATIGSAGADLYACLDKDIVLPAGTSAFLPCGFAMAIPQGYVGLVYARSGLASKKGLAPSNKVGVIDSDYRGEITVSIFNHSKEERTIASGDRIAQLVIAPVIQADFSLSDDLDETDRGTGGFGSTGK